MLQAPNISGDKIRFTHECNNFKSNVNFCKKKDSFFLSHIKQLEYIKLILNSDE